jgi:transposase
VAGIGIGTFAGVPRQARLLTYCGYEVKIVSPHLVKPFIKTNKTDANDTQAICMAMGRPNKYPGLLLINFVALHLLPKILTRDIKRSCRLDDFVIVFG